MPEERIEFGQVLDGLFLGAMEGLKDPALVEKLRAGGLDLNGKLALAYPAATFFRFAAIAANHRYPSLDETEAMRELGRLAVRRGMESTLMGRAVLKAAQLLGVRRALKRVGRMMKNGNNYIEGMANELSPTSMEVQLGPLVGPKSYYEGILEESAVILGGKNVKLVHLRNEGEHVLWRIDWEN